MDSVRGIAGVVMCVGLVVVGFFVGKNTTHPPPPPAAPATKIVEFQYTLHDGREMPCLEIVGVALDCDWWEAKPSLPAVPLPPPAG